MRIPFITKASREALERGKAHAYKPTWFFYNTDTPKYGLNFPENEIAGEIALEEENECILGSNKMNKNDAMKQIEEFKIKLAELEATVNEPDFNPKDLVGKLCYVWNPHQSDAGCNNIRLVLNYLSEDVKPFITSGGSSWTDARPVPEAEVLKLIYRPKRTTRYDWSKAPKNAKYMYTDSTGDIFCSTERYSLSGFMCSWVFVKGIDYNRCLLVKGIKTCEDWDKSEEARPE